MDSSSHHHPIRRFLYPTAFGKAGPDIGWEPSPAGVVDDMIRLARVCPEDVVYDLGCGDGRIVIAAAKAGAHGVGVDIDEQKIAESRDNALRAGVGDLARFVNRNLFAADISDATVLFLFLFPDVNLRLRPRLLKELRPGTRVVSYSHDMGRWEPDRMSGDVYLWIVPANMSGTWEGTIETGSGRVPLRMNIRQEFQHASGAVFAGGEVLQVPGVAMEGEAFAFGEGGRRRDGAMSVSGVVEGDVVTGTIIMAATGEESIFSARRIHSTRTSLAQ
jgi:SAM-dependent methyltransferase